MPIAIEILVVYYYYSSRAWSSFTALFTALKLLGLTCFQLGLLYQPRASQFQTLTKHILELFFIFTTDSTKEFIIRVV